MAHHLLPHLLLRLEAVDAGTGGPPCCSAGHLLSDLYAHTCAAPLRHPSTATGGGARAFRASKGAALRGLGAAAAGSHERVTIESPLKSQSCAPKLHSCFLERSRQQEATTSFAYCSLCMHAAASLRMLAASAGVSPTEHRRAAPTRAAAVRATHGGAMHSRPRRQRVPGTSAAIGGTLCGKTERP
jgi:hypothetical protein